MATDDPAERIAPAETGAPPAAAWHLTVAYDGSAYCGWQVQPDQRTIQGEFRQRLRLLFRDPTLTPGATSRTDTGVHALDQHLSFPERTPCALTPATVQRTLNRWLPPDIRVLRAERREPGFHARFAAVAKAYTYVICPKAIASPFVHRYAWVFPAPLDAEAMRAAAATFAGEHDFASFAVNPRCPERVGEATVRRLHRIELLEQDGLLYLNVIGDSFLYKMVRSLAGFLVHVGRGAVPPAAAASVLAARDRRAAADSAPGQGLFLARVFFREGEWATYVPRLPPFAWQGPPEAAPATPQVTAAASGCCDGRGRPLSPPRC
jgi:tRNA pseudouridine38-40 synthase